MNWIRNLKIAHKLLVFVAILSLFISIVGFIGFYFTNTNAEKISYMYSNSLLPTNYLNKIKTNFTKIDSNLFQMNIVKTKAESQKLHEEILDLRAQDNKLMELYLKTKLTSEEKQVIANYKNNLKNYRVLQKYVIDCTNNGQQQKGLNYMFSHPQYLNKIHNSIDNLIELSLKKAEDLNIQSKNDTTKAISLIISIIIGVLIASISLALLLTKIIAEPINLVVKNLNEIAKGNLSIAELKINSKDESGQLAQALNSTVKNLRNLIQSVANTISDISASSEEMSASADQTAEGSQQTAFSTAQLAQGAQEISTNVELGAITINKMNKVIQDVYKEAQIVSKLGNDTEMNANKGSKHVQNAVGKIDNIKTVADDISVTVTKLGKLSSEIETIVDLIKGIAS